MPVYQAGAHLLSGTGAGSGTVNGVYNNRAGGADGYVYYSAAGASAIITLVGSHDASAWLPVATVTAVTGTDGGSLAVSSFYPYLGAQINALYSGAAGTAAPIVHFTPVVIG